MHGTAFAMPANCIPSFQCSGGFYSGIEWHQSVECYHGRARDNDIKSISLAKTTFVPTPLRASLEARQLSVDYDS